MKHRFIFIDALVAGIGYFLWELSWTSVAIFSIVALVLRKIAIIMSDESPKNHDKTYECATKTSESRKLSKVYNRDQDLNKTNVPWCGKTDRARYTQNRMRE